MSYRITRRSAMAGALAGSALSVGAQRAWAQGGKIQVGFVQALSGSLEYVGKMHLNGVQIAAKMINDAGGVEGRQVEIVARDNRGSANDMVAGIRELTGSGVNLLHGCAFSHTNLAAVPLIPSLNAVYVAPTVIAMELTHDLYSPNVFRAGQNAYMQFLAQAKAIASKNPNVKRWGCLVGDNAGFRFAQTYLYAGLRKYYGALGKQIELMDPIVVKVPNSEFRIQANELLSQNLDGLIIAHTGADAITFVKQARAFGLFNKMAAVGDMTYSPNLGPSLRKDMPNNYFSTCTWFYDAFKHLPMVPEFYKQAVEVGKNPIPDPFLAQAHLGLTTIIAGVRQAKSTKTEDVIKALETVKFDSVYGPMSFRPEDHQMRFNPGYVRLGPADTADGWKIEEFISVPFEEAVEPPTPGKKFEI